MADLRSGGTGCSDRCGCPVPCPGGTSCRCTTSQTTAGGGEGGHSKCSCGEHCGCNPCTCPRSGETTGVGKAHCKCGDSCTCATCAA